MQDHVHCVPILAEVLLLLDQKLVHARNQHVHLGQPLVLLQKREEHGVKVALEVAGEVGGEDRLGDHLLDLVDLEVVPRLLDVELEAHEHDPRVVVLLHEVFVLGPVAEGLLGLEVLHEVLEVLQQGPGPGYAT